jgi:spore germination cell wall hydrolase CwlJ-like protein
MKVHFHDIKEITLKLYRKVYMLTYKKLASIAILSTTFFTTTLTIPYIDGFEFYKNKNYTQQDIVCLAKNIYFESRGEPMTGKLHVAKVTLNRANHDTLFDKTVCKVVYANKQFSWTDQKLKVKDGIAWREAQLLAKGILQGYILIPTTNALYFHAKDIKPKWAKTKTIVAKIGNHIFYS